MSVADARGHNVDVGVPFAFRAPITTETPTLRRVSGPNEVPPKAWVVDVTRGLLATMSAVTSTPRGGYVSPGRGDGERVGGRGRAWGTERWMEGIARLASTGSRAPLTMLCAPRYNLSPSSPTTSEHTLAATALLAMSVPSSPFSLVRVCRASWWTTRLREPGEKPGGGYRASGPKPGVGETRRRVRWSQFRSLASRAGMAGMGARRSHRAAMRAMVERDGSTQAGSRRHQHNDTVGRRSGTLAGEIALTPPPGFVPRPLNPPCFCLACRTPSPPICPCTFNDGR